MPVTPATLLDAAITGGSLACALASAAVACRARARARTDRVALRSARAREAAFLEAARRLAGAARTSVTAVREEIVRAARVAAPVADGILLYERGDDELRCTTAVGDRFAHFAGTRVAPDDRASLAARALSAGHHVTLAGTGVPPPHPGDAAAVAVPVVLDPGRACVLVASTRHSLNGDTLERLVMLADQASSAYLIALDREQDRRSADFDGLTGLLTPQAFRRRLNALVESARFVPSARLALLFVDTDRFKRFNDRYGHAAGDTLLRELAAVIRAAAASERDLAARNGGDEFCLVFTETEKATAIERADGLRRRIAALGDERVRASSAPAGHDLRISASIGVAAFPADAPNATDLLERADAAMYHAKNSGRDGVSYLDAARAFVRLAR